MNSGDRCWRVNGLRALPRGRATRLICPVLAAKDAPTSGHDDWVLLDAGLHSAASKRQPSGGSVGAIVWSRIEGNRRTGGSPMNRVDDSFE